MKKKGFATSAILYTLLLLFLVLMVGILNNLQNKKTILDALKKDTINALEKNTITDAILDQIGIINSKIVEIETRISDYESNTYTKAEVDKKIDIQQIRSIYIEPTDTETQLQSVLEQEYTRLSNYSCGRVYLVMSANTTDLHAVTWLLETCNSGNTFGTQTAKTYSLVGIIYKARSRLGGEWGPWREFSQNN